MSFLSTLFDFMFPLASTSDCESEAGPLGAGSDSIEMMAINPANGMPMVDGMGCIDVTGNLWGQSESLGGGIFCTSIDYETKLLDSGSMFDTGSMLESCSMFD